jgi:DNA-binding MarR family transcriptional regulator
MSTRSDPTVRPTRAARLANGSEAVPADVSPDALAVEMASFVQAFQGWVRLRAHAAGASAPRLRLLYSLHCEGPSKMADLAESLGVTPRNVTALVDALEAEGTVRRTAHPTDRRITMIELVGQPGALVDQFAAFNGALGGLFAGLDPDDRVALARILRSLEGLMGGTEAATG